MRKVLEVDLGKTTRRFEVDAVRWAEFERWFRGCHTLGLEVTVTLDKYGKLKGEIHDEAGGEL